MSGFGFARESMCGRDRRSRLLERRGQFVPQVGHSCLDCVPQARLNGLIRRRLGLAREDERSRVGRIPAVSTLPCRRRGWQVYAPAASGVPLPLPCARFWRPGRPCAPAPVFWPPPPAPTALPTSAYALAVKNMPHGF